MPIINTALTLKDLPPPPLGKSGWPWTEQRQPLPERMPDGSEWPRISIVTPSYNQSQFIEETIRSVLLQGYPNLEYIIIDGGSTDKSVEIIKKYEQYLAYWVSEADRGQSHALNKGFRRATGVLIGWQNSDDFYHISTFEYAAIACLSHPNADILYGQTVRVDEQSNYLGNFPFPDSDMHAMLPYNIVNNQALFWRNKVFQDGQFLDESLHHAMDYEFNWRLKIADYYFLYVPKMSGSFRSQSGGKSTRQSETFAREYALIYSRLFKNKALPESVRSKAIAALHGLCLDNFLKLRREFRPSVRHLIIVGGWQYVDAKLILKYILSYTGHRGHKLILNLKSRGYQNNDIN